jgi:salicylate hydroxylase
MNGVPVNGRDQPFDVAIIGGGIVGVILALGLIKRDINVKIYEQSKGFREIGAGIVFTPNAVKSMGILDPRIVDALKRVVTTNGGPDTPNDFLTWVDGYNHEGIDPNDTTEKLLFSLYTGYRGFSGCHRAHFMDEIAKLMPEGHIVFGKRLETYVDRGEDSKVLMKFVDGTTTEADAGKYLYLY